jgi:hypothetical protein
MLVTSSVLLAYAIVIFFGLISNPKEIGINQDGSPIDDSISQLNDMNSTGSSK